jgi:hypothetical protein
MKLSWLIALTITLPHSLANDPVQVLNQLSHSSPAVRAKAAQTYGDGCRDRKLRRSFRRERSAQAKFEQALRDREAMVRKASIHMALCFGPEKSLGPLSTLFNDLDSATALAAMTQVAHYEHPLGVAPLKTWMESRLDSCQSNEERFRERCVFSAYALGQAAQHEAPGSLIKREAVQGLTPFLLSAHPKTREVAAVALSFVGDQREAELISKLLTQEQSGEYPNKNTDEVLEHFKALIAKLKMVSIK